MIQYTYLDIFTMSILKSVEINSILGKVLNVNCELHGFKPLTFTEIQSILSLKENNWDLIQKNESFSNEEK